MRTERRNDGLLGSMPGGAQPPPAGHHATSASRAPSWSTTRGISTLGGRENVMDRRRFLLTLLSSVTLWSFTTEAQAGKVYRVGLLGEKPQTRRKLASGRSSGQSRVG